MGTLSQWPHTTTVQALNRRKSQLRHQGLGKDLSIAMYMDSNRLRHTGYHGQSFREAA